MGKSATFIEKKAPKESGEKGKELKGLKGFYHFEEVLVEEPIVYPKEGKWKSKILGEYPEAKGWAIQVLGPTGRTLDVDPSRISKLKKAPKEPPAPEEGKEAEKVWNRIKAEEKVIVGDQILDEIEKLIPATGPDAALYKNLVTTPNPNQVGILDKYVASLKITPKSPGRGEKAPELTEEERQKATFEEDIKRKIIARMKAESIKDLSDMEIERVLKDTVSAHKLIPKAIELRDAGLLNLEDLGLKPIPSKPPAEEVPPKFKKGDIITDGLVNGKVISEGSIKFGKKDVPGYKIEILTGHEKGNISFIFPAALLRIGR